MSQIEQSLERMMEMWNERESSKIKGLCEAVMDPDIEFCDPLHHIWGIEAFIAMVCAFRQNYPDAILTRTSKIDRHHDRARYDWLIVQDGKVITPGFDVAQIGPDGKVKRVDGFFGPLRPR